MSTLKFREAAPAYLEYAADLLANRQFRLMTFGERGLLSTMKYECWVNGSVPADPSKLARLLGEPPETMSQLLTPAVLDFFHEGFSPDGQVLICPDLEQYRLKLTERREAQGRAATSHHPHRHRGGRSLARGGALPQRGGSV